MVKKKKRQKVPAPPPWLGRRILYIVRMSEPGAKQGRHAGVFAPMIEQVLASGAVAPVQVYDVPGNAHLRAFDVRHFFALAAAGDFGAAEVLHAPPERIARFHQAFGAALACRDHLLSKRVAQSALDFANGILVLSWRHPATREAVRQLTAAHELLRTGAFPADVHGPEPSRKLERMRNDLVHEVKRAMATSRVRESVAVTDLDSICATVLGATFGHRIHVPVQGEWKSEPMEFGSGTLYNIDLSGKQP